MTAHGQLDLEGHEHTAPRVEKAAKALWLLDARRAWGQDGADVARENAARLWQRVRGEYVKAAEAALAAADA